MYPHLLERATLAARLRSGGYRLSTLRTAKVATAGNNCALARRAPAGNQSVTEAADERASFHGAELENKRRAHLRRPRRLLRPQRTRRGPRRVLAVFFCESPFPVLSGTVFAPYDDDDDAAWAPIGLSVGDWDISRSFPSSFFGPSSSHIPALPEWHFDRARAGRVLKLGDRLNRRSPTTVDF